MPPDIISVVRYATKSLVKNLIHVVSVCRYTTCVPEYPRGVHLTSVYRQGSAEYFFGF